VAITVSSTLDTFYSSWACQTESVEVRDNSLSVYAWTDFYLHASLGNGCSLYVYLYLHVNKHICSSSAFVLLFLKGLLIPSKIRISSIWFRWQFSPHEQQEIEMNCFWNEPLLIQAVQQVLE